MSLYNPPKNKVDDETMAFDLIDAHGFATLITPASENCFVSHLPLVLDRERRRLQGHLAAANEHTRHLEDGPSIAVFHGPHAYMSATWYPHATVSTWNYSVCHVGGPIEIVDDDALRKQLASLAKQYESPRPDPWPMPRDQIDPRLHRIVGFEMALQTVETKFKLDQHYDDDVADHLAERLEAEDPGRTAHQQVAWMMRHSRKS